MADTYLITGATGFVGGHVVDACLERGIAVHALARPSSDTRLLDRPGVRLFTGDVTDPASLPPALEGADVVVHCAAKVGDWGPVDDYRRVNVGGLRNLLEACRGRPLRRFVHISTLGVYEARHHHGTDETEPLPESHIDGYTQSKVEAERVALEYHKEHGVPVVILRPGFVYGPRDRTVLPTLVAALRRGIVWYFGGGRAALNTTAVRNLVDAVFLAAERPEAVGQVYNITDGEFVSKRRFFEAIADGLDLPRPWRSVPLWLGKTAARLVEGRARRKGWPTAPRLTQARIKFLGLNLDFSIAKARRELGYNPRYGFDEAMRETVEWLRGQADARGGEGAAPAEPSQRWEGGAAAEPLTSAPQQRRPPENASPPHSSPSRVDGNG
ncbi:MAG TPA: NAD-dependent epimerase/dehydratase family protein [Gemmataceae bacterium]